MDARTGQTFTLADLQGKTVYVEPMATWCTNCRQQFLPEESPYCSYHPDPPTIVGNYGPRSNYEDVWEYPCCERKVVTAVDDTGRDMTPPQSPGCRIVQTHSLTWGGER